MHPSVLLISLICFQMARHAYSQKMDYTPPEALQHSISKADYKKIVDLALPLIEKRYKIKSVKQGAIELIDNEELHVLNLDNVVLKCIQIKNKEQWKGVVQEHFNQLFISIDEQKKIDPRDFETIKKYLSLRIYPKEAVLQRGGTEKIIFKTDLEDTYTVLMLDLPGAFTSVSKPVFDLWNKSNAEIFKMAQDNINTQTVTKVTKLFPIDGNDIEISFIADENYTASYALDLLHNSPDLVGEWGSVVAIPNRGIVDICKISKDKPLDFVKFIQIIKPMVEKSYTEHPQPVSNQFFWYYKETFTRITVTIDNGQTIVISPFGLTELMTIKK